MEAPPASREEGNEEDSVPASALELVNQPIWQTDEDCATSGSLLLPFEAALISLLLSSQHRRDVSLAVSISRNLALTDEASAIRAKVVLIYHSHRNEAKPRRALMPRPLFQFSKRRTKCDWVYIPSVSAETSTGYSSELCEVLRHPDRTARPISARAGYLIPSKSVMQDEGGGAALWEVALQALEANQLDCFRVAVECWKKTGITFGAFKEPEGRLQLLDLLSSTPFIDPERYLMLIPLPEILDEVDPLSAIVSVAQRPTLFKAVCETLREVRSIDIHDTLFEGDALQTLFEMISDEVIPIAINYFRPGGRDPCDVFLEAFSYSSVSAQIVGWSFLQLKPPIVLELTSNSYELLQSALENCDGSDGETLERVAFLKRECTSDFAFDMVGALRGFSQAGESFPSCPLETLRFIFSDDIRRRIREIIDPAALLLYFQSDRAMRFALEELQYPLTPDEVGALFLLALRFSKFVGAAIALGPRVLALDAENQKDCWDRLWLRTLDESPPNREAVAKLLKLFAARHWLPPAANRPGTLPSSFWGMRLGKAGVARLEPQSARRRFKGDGVCVRLIKVLQHEVGLDFRQDVYPLFSALTSEAWQVVQYLLEHRLFPNREALVRYRWYGLTLLHLLFRTTTLDPAANAASDYIDLVRHLGVDVVRELSFVGIKPCEERKAGYGADGELPLTVACRYWPLEALVYLVNDLDIGGSRGDELKHVLSSLTPGTPAHLFLRQLQEQEFLFDFLSGR
jgi:hypothetical protein